jgi:hypothetical protein
MFDYKKPCSNCPWRKSQAPNFRLSAWRLEEIFYATAFECHKTVHSDKAPQQCVGLIALQAKEQQLNTITRAAIALIDYDPTAIDDSDTFDTLQEAITAHLNPY